MDQQILLSAIAYAKQDLPIIACCDVDHKCNVNMEHHMKMCRCQGKAPIIKWREKTHTTAQEVIDWKNQFGEFNLGLPMGAVTGYIGIDVDGPGGEPLLQQMCGTNVLPETWKFTTGDGYRLLFQIPQGFQTKKYCLTDPNNKHSECAILCDGQFSVIPPSKHHSGKRYAWVAGHSPDTMDCAMAPNWLLDLVRADKPDVLKRTEKKVNDFVINFEQNNKPAFAEKMADFAVAEFSAEIPDELLNAEFKQPKGNVSNNNSQTGTPMKSWIEMKTGDVISEGGRDNALMMFIGALLSDPSIRGAGKAVAKMIIDEYNREKLDPPLEEEAITVKLESIWAKEEMKTAEYKAAADAKKPFIPDEQVQILKNTLDEEGLTFTFDIDNNEVYFFKNGIGPWQKKGASAKLQNMVKKIFKQVQGRPEWVKSGNIDEVIRMFKLDECEGEEDRGNIFIETKDNALLQQYLPVDGKLLDWKTGEVTSWTKDFLTTSNFEVEYDPEAKCPNWEKYMAQWLPDPEYRNLLQEFLGCAMLPAPDADAKFIILTGTGANGKSMCLDAIEDIFGNMSVSQELGRLTKDQFGTAKLYGKRLNICSELTEADGYIKDSSIMKRLVSGETVNIERKGKDGFDYQPIASHIFSSNSIPRVRDKSDGWYRRQVVVPFEQKFEANQGVAEVMKRNIASERAGIFNWLLEGLRRKTTRGKYVIPQGLQEVQQQVRIEQDPLLQFTTKYLRIGSGISDRADAAAFMGDKYKKATHGIAANILHGLFSAWYMLEMSDKTNGMAIKTFKTYYAEHYGVQTMGQCHSIAKSKNTSVMLAIDFLYNDELVELIDNILESNAMSAIDGGILPAIQIIKKNIMRLQNGEKLEDV